MPFEPFTFDESAAQTEPGRPHVPEGYYLFEGVKIEPTAADYAKTTGIYATVKFVAGPETSPDSGIGREMRDYSALGGKKTSDGRGTQFGIGQLLGAFGMTDIAKKLPGMNIDSYAKLEALCRNLSALFAGKRACGLVADQPGTQGRAFSGIEEWLPASDWDTLKKARLSAVPAAPRPAAVNGASPAASVVAASVAAEVDDLFK
jgi:hypothetical protein